MRELRLRTSLVLMLVTAVMLTFLIVASAILLYRLPQIEAYRRAELQEQAASTSRLLDQYMAGVESQVRTLARVVANRTLVELQADLDAMVGDGEIFEAAYIVAANGAVHALGLPGKVGNAAADLLGADLSMNRLFQAARVASGKGDPAPAIWSDKFLSALSGTNTVGVALSAGEHTVIGEVSLERVLALFHNLAPGSDATTILVLDHQGQWLASTRADARGRFVNFALYPAFQAIVSGRPLPEYERLQGQRVLVGGVLSKHLNWVIATAEPAGLENPIYRTTIILVVGGFAGSLLLGAALAPLWAAMIARPLNALIARTHRATDGDYSSPWPRRGAITELNQLSRDLGHMVKVIETREAETARSSERLRATLENTPSVAVQWYDVDGRVLYWNRASEIMYGFPSFESVGSVPGQDLPMYMDQKQADDFVALLKEIDRSGQPVGPAEFTLRKKDGSPVVVLFTCFAIPDEDERKIIVRMDVDVTERKKAEERIHELAFHDQLTGLANRILLLDRLKHAMAASSRHGGHGALLFIDLDNFKALNDTSGHETGDILLQQVAQRLGGCVREGDTVARLGGDEFVVMLEGLSASSSEAASQTETAGKKILRALGDAYEINGQQHTSTPSVGVTLFIDRREPMDELLKRADMAMYQAKAAGRNTLRFFDPEMQAAVAARVAMESDLRKALVKGEFVLHYQPQVDSSGRLVGAEALVRWEHPERGLVSPATFIPLAEESGLILPLGDWVLETACTQLAVWAATPEMAHLTLAVNISTRQFSSPNFVEQVLAVVDSSLAPSRRLKLELTESVLMDNAEDIIAKMIALKARGVGFSMDDFGTGYSSLSYLKRLPLDQLKIDQSFVRHVLTDPNEATIARTIITLGKSLGLAVIAEGVETEGQRAFLIDADCHVFQGYLFSRPLPVAAFEAFVKGV